MFTEAITAFAKTLIKHADKPIQVYKDGIEYLRYDIFKNNEIIFIYFTTYGECDSIEVIAN